MAPALTPCPLRRHICPVNVGTSADDLRVSVAALRRTSHALAGEVARIAGEIAVVMEQIAADRDRLATVWPDRAVELRARAEHIRRFARSEREQQRRWQQMHDAEA